MKRKKPWLFLTAIIIIASVILFYQSEKTLFPDKLGDMGLKLHREGDVAIREIKGSHEAKDNVNPREANIARYRNSAGSRAAMSLTVAESNQRAVEIVENMNRGMGGMFSKPETLEINGLKVYYTEGGGEYHYYYPKNNFVVWIALSNPDRAYQSTLMNEAIKSEIIMRKIFGDLIALGFSVLLVLALISGLAILLGFEKPENIEGGGHHDLTEYAYSNWIAVLLSIGIFSFFCVKFSHPD